MEEGRGVHGDKQRPDLGGEHAVLLTDDVLENVRLKPASFCSPVSPQFTKKKKEESNYQRTRGAGCRCVSYRVAAEHPAWGSQGVGMLRTFG